MFLDESGFSLSPLVKRTWGPRGKTPVYRRPGRSRDKISSISCISVSPKRQRLGFFFRHSPKKNVKAPEVLHFLKPLLRRLPGRIVVLWDGGTPHKAKQTKAFLNKHTKRLVIERFPPYAPELNPDEHIWTQLKYHELCNHGCLDLPTLHRRLLSRSAKLRRKQDVLWSCIRLTRLPLRRPK